MKYRFNLQLFDDGEGAGAGNGDQANHSGGNGSTGGYSFQQAEEIANARAERAEKAALASYFKQQGMSEEEITQAIADFKTKKAANQPNVSAIEKERDDARAELNAMKHQAAIRLKGVPEDNVEFVEFKVAALMSADSKLDFDKALDKFLKDNPRYAASGAYRVKTGTDGSQGSGAKQGNSSINDAIRAAARR